MAGVTKLQIAERIVEKTSLYPGTVRIIVQGVLDNVIDTIVREGHFELRKFGVFRIKLRKAREARNPRTGESVMVPAKKVVVFRAGKVMSRRVHGGE